MVSTMGFPRVRWSNGHEIIKNIFKNKVKVIFRPITCKIYSSYYLYYLTFWGWNVIAYTPVINVFTIYYYQVASYVFCFKIIIYQNVLIDSCWSCHEDWLILVKLYTYLLVLWNWEQVRKIYKLTRLLKITIKIYKIITFRGWTKSTRNGKNLPTMWGNILLCAMCRKEQVLISIYISKLSSRENSRKCYCVFFL